jgi:hypothetical protein
MKWREDWRAWRGSHCVSLNENRRGLRKAASMANGPSKKTSLSVMAKKSAAINGNVAAANEMKNGWRK